MKYIRFAIAVICVFTIFCGFANAAEEMEEQIQHAKITVGANDSILLDQGYSINVIDVNSENGDLFIEVYVNEKKVEQGIVKENKPFRYLKTIEDEDDEETDYLIFNVSLQGTEDKDGETYSEIIIKQYIDPEIAPDDYLMLDDSVSLNIGKETELKEDYTIKATDLDDETVTITLRKNGNIIKETEDIGEGDVFAYTRKNGDRLMTIFMGEIDTIFETTDSDHVILKKVIQKTDEGIGDGLEIKIEVPEKNPANEKAIISYTLDGYADRVEIYVDGDLIDQRKEVDEDTYDAVTDKLSTGEYNIEIKAITSEGIMITESALLIVGKTAKEENPENDAGDIIEKAENVTSSASEAVDKINETTTALEKVPAPGAFFAIFILLGAWVWCRKR
ncbi:S-layer protein domain-containing protein [Methanohalophilus portucalensis]|uniref:PEP-CTERM protein-sorting domain-containing protein n=2 Tax=Methanohalophilus portucalensis TaxID=39664 RepID=A0A1L9C575_9EURY|nr:S-layer protein domain-containing protein [Methanohalophilus portucalensis]ATU08354.1 hypothetical protein BKM01_05950 [Methanohalophilus portucalensis]OJH49682.1 hypothetical protein MPF_0470 [Methanohalophilus portucalensis FDF-1]RNI13481.1 hypothetical protein EFE41_02570 [Methanohalophilus portucalensis FDF-1]SMH34666.1 PEP-CTERM protein-sorting domain-containing protein [Methanohalophilus portucalensis FDF-1]